MMMMNEDWSFPELDGDFFEVAVRTGDYCPEDINDNPRDHDRQFPEDWCDDDDDDDDDDIMMEEYEMQGGGGGGDDDSSSSSGELWVLKKRQEKHIKKYDVKQVDFTFRPSQQHKDSYANRSLADNLQNLTTSLEALVPTAVREANLPANSYAAVTMQSKPIELPYSSILDAGRTDHCKCHRRDL